MVGHTLPMALQWPQDRQGMRHLDGQQVGRCCGCFRCLTAVELRALHDEEVKLKKELGKEVEEEEEDEEDPVCVRQWGSLWGSTHVCVWIDRWGVGFAQNAECYINAQIGRAMAIETTRMGPGLAIEIAANWPRIGRTQQQQCPPPNQHQVFPSLSFNQVCCGE